MKVQKCHGGLNNQALTLEKHLKCDTQLKHQSMKMQTTYNIKFKLSRHEIEVGLLKLGDFDIKRFIGGKVINERKSNAE